jgi:hypothetical protein
MAYQEHRKGDNSNPPPRHEDDNVNPSHFAEPPRPEGSEGTTTQLPAHPLKRAEQGELVKAEMPSKYPNCDAFKFPATNKAMGMSNPNASPSHYGPK